MEVRDSPSGAILVIGVQPSARKRELRQDRQGRTKLAVTEPPQDGRANRALVEFVAEILAVRKGQVTLVAGMGSRRKTFLVRGLSAAEVSQRLSAR
jgi:uncharacterized protein (TIGR00251 family)